MPDAQPAQDRSALSPLRSWAAVTGLTAAVFAVTVSETLPLGVLPELASDLGVTEGAAGMSVTVYGLVAGLGAQRDR